MDRSSIRVVIAIVQDEKAIVPAAGFFESESGGEGGEEWVLSCVIVFQTTTPVSDII